MKNILTNHLYHKYTDMSRFQLKSYKSIKKSYVLSRRGQIDLVLISTKAQSPACNQGQCRGLTVSLLLYISSDSIPYRQKPPLNQFPHIYTTSCNIGSFRPTKTHIRVPFVSGTIAPWLDPCLILVCCSIWHLPHMKSCACAIQLLPICTPVLV